MLLLLKYSRRIRRGNRNAVPHLQDLHQYHPHSHRGECSGACHIDLDGDEGQDAAYNWDLHRQLYR